MSLLLSGGKVYVIIVYDVNVKRVNKVKKFLRQYLNWIQNSVFEGELTDSEYQRILYNLKNLIDEKEDSIIIFKFKHKYLFKREILGVVKNDPDDIFV